MDAANKSYVDLANSLILSNGTFLKVVSATNPNWDARGYNLTNLNLTPTSGTDAATMNFVLIKVGNVTGSTGINGTYYILLDPTSTFVGINNPSPRWALDVTGIINATNFRTNESGGNVFIGVTSGKADGSNASTLVGEGAGYPAGASSQTALGYRAGYLNTGSYQTAIGSSAGYQNTGSYQTAIGSSAGYKNTGSYQMALGVSAGYQNKGFGQTAIGSTAGESNTGSFQTAVGYDAGYQNTGTLQTAVGYDAGRSNTGKNVSAFGVNSGDSNSGANLVAIGNYSGYQNTGSNVTAIGSNAGRGNAIDNIFILMQREANRIALIEGNFTNGQVRFPNYVTGVAVFDAFGNISSNTTYPQALAANDTQRPRGGISRLSVIQTIVGTSATEITGLSFPIAAMETVQFDSMIEFGSRSLNGTFFSITIPSGAINATMFCPVVKTGIPSTFNQSLILSSATITGETCNHEANQRGWATFTGTVQNAGTGGTVQFNIANKRASTLTVNASSYVKWNRLDSYTAGGI
jgi:hypothetical protein